MYSIGEFARKARVTVRSLHHYEEIGLLLPSATTEGGHRLYSDQDFIRLQQIVLLKSLGFSLQAIRQILDREDSWEDSLRTQLKIVKEEQERLKLMENGLKALLFSYQIEGKIKWETLFQMFEYSKTAPSEREKVLSRQLSGEEMEILSKVPKLDQDELALQKWVSLLKEVKYHQQLDPGCEQAQQIAKKLYRETLAWFDGDAEMVEKFWEMIKNPDEHLRFYPFDEQMIEFIDQATEIYLRGEHERV
ncbi:MerR family transcriptional regulator [Lihuaxuella thermophila]|uniref:DNA-binding transcriptional regulator, MerR family n=1 Tax=Lihuaxuella thermophila TaxID=1173111 RepID=A0A1H8H814_9BACL|nr:MerR family transcriptional regulator [Lihuaxuella thermophila]SEN52174.1 DNA-binding transcriptional regulator, MerR family [Lihuaxuella thermophila]